MTYEGLYVQFSLFTYSIITAKNAQEKQNFTCSVWEDVFKAIMSNNHNRALENCILCVFYTVTPITEAYSELCKTIKTDYFAKIVNGSHLLFIFVKRSFLDVWQGSDYPSGTISWSLFS